MIRLFRLRARQVSRLLAGAVLADFAQRVTLALHRLLLPFALLVFRVMAARPAAHAVFALQVTIAPPAVLQSSVLLAITPLSKSRFGLPIARNALRINTPLRVLSVVFLVQ